MRLPKEFVTENLEKAKGSTVFGVSFDDMTRDELVACAVAGFVREKQEREDADRFRAIMGGYK